MINAYNFILEKQQKYFAKEIYLYIFLFTYTLNAPKINNLYMTKKSILKGK